MDLLWDEPQVQLELYMDKFDPETRINKSWGVVQLAYDRSLYPEVVSSKL